MTWQTLRTRQFGKLLMVTLCRPEQHNAINRRMLEEIQAVLDLAEADPNLRIVGLEGQPGTFCTGLDFEDIATQNATQETIAGTARLYFQTLLRFRRLSKLVACRIDGRVQAGGIGFAAACDYAVCSSTATFQLSEILLGLLPATVMPFLIRRVGQHAAFRLSLTAQVLTADQAAALGLVDETAPSLEDGWRKFLISSERLSLPAMAALKSYSQELEGNLETFEPMAVSRITELLCLPATQERIRELQQHGLWQTGRPGGSRDHK